MTIHTKSTVPFGSWRSAISPAMVAAARTRLAEPLAVGDATYWLESQPAQDGRTSVMRHTPHRGVEAITPKTFDCRSRAHEYGGGAYTVHRATIFFVHFADQRVYRQDPGSAPRPITPPPPTPSSPRYADLCVSADGSRLVCVRERHEGEAVHNELVVIDTRGGRTPSVLTSGEDFYAFPRLSPDATRLAWTAWNHPNMPWDGTELLVAEMSSDGRLSEPRRVAGGRRESIFQPQWSPAGVLHFVSDRTGWWNLYRLGARGPQPLTAMKAEIGEPQWTFGQSSYAFLDDAIAFVGRHGARQRLMLLDGDRATMTELPVPHSAFDVPGLKASGERLVFVGAGPALAEGIVSFERSNGRSETLRLSTPEPISCAISVPRAIEYLTTGGQMARALFYEPRNDDCRGPRDELPPAIVISHGGPTGQAMTGLDPSVQLWTSRGFAVIDVDYRGSTGYGREYREQLRGQWGVADVEDCVNATRHLADEIDVRRTAIRGASAGGYTTLCALTFTDAFAAGASYFGVGDLETLTRDTHKFESHYLDALIGPYPQTAALYRERSPIHSVDRLSCPIILFQGMLDEVVPPNQAQAMADALRAAGIVHAHICFPDEAHGFRVTQNIKQALDAELAFYARVFGFEPAEEIAAAR